MVFFGKKKKEEVIDAPISNVYVGDKVVQQEEPMKSAGETSIIDWVAATPDLEYRAQVFGLLLEINQRLITFDEVEGKTEIQASSNSENNPKPNIPVSIEAWNCGICGRSHRTKASAVTCKHGK